MEKELKELRDRCISFLNLMLEMYGGPKSDIIILESKKGIERAFLDNNIKGLKIAIKDFNNWLKDFPKPDQKKFKTLLNEGVKNKDVEKIIKSNKINNDDEYRLIVEYLNDVENLHNTNVVEKLNKILVSYDSLKKR